MRSRFPTDQSNRARVCPKCGKAMPRSYTGKLCPACDDELLYREVKEYILSHDVSEMQVADHFDIPLSKVHDWVTEGYLAYRNDKKMR